MTRFPIHGAVLALLCLPGYAEFRAQQLLQVPAEPGQQVVDLKTDSHGNLIVAATVKPPSGQTEPFSDPANYALRSLGLIKKVGRNGSEVFSRILPGLAPARPPLLVTVDSRDDIYVAGTTYAPGTFPFTNNLVPPGTLSGTFLVKFRTLDGTVAYATSLGTGTPQAIVVDGNGQAVIVVAGAGATFATTPGAYSSSNLNESSQIYVVRLSQAGDSLISVARYGGCDAGSGCGDKSEPADTEASQAMLAARGNIWIAGVTNALDLPVTPDALDPQCGCSGHAYRTFLAEISGDGSRLVYATYIGATAKASDYNDVAAAAALDKAGHVWMAGDTGRPDFPVTSNATQKRFGGGNLDGFITEFDPATNQVLYATYFGGEGDDAITSLQIMPDGTAIIVGQSKSMTLPVVPTGFTRGADFIASVDPRAYAVAATKFPGGTTGSGTALTPQGSIVVAGAGNVVAFLEPGGDASPSLYGVANSASGPVAGQVAKYEIISLYGANIGPAAPVAADLGSGQAPAQLGGVQVFVDGNPAPLLYAQSDQINAILPLAEGTTTHIVVSSADGNSNEAVLGVAAAAPAVFKTGASSAAALNEDGTINGPDNPARLGAIVSVFATGFGGFSPPVNDGSVLTGALPTLQEAVQALWLPANVVGPGLGGVGLAQPLEVTYAGPAPNLLAGVIQVNFRLPSSAVIAFPNLPEVGFQFLVGGWACGAFVFVK